MFSVGSESLGGVFVLSVVVNSGRDGVSSRRVCEVLDQVAVLSIRDEEVGEFLRALERQGFVYREGVKFCATDAGRERVESVETAFRECEGKTSRELESEIVQ